MHTEDNPVRQQQLIEYLQHLCVKCGSIHGEETYTTNQVKCEACGYIWNFIMVDDFEEVLETLEQTFEVDLNRIQIPNRFREIDTQNIAHIRAAELAKFVANNRV